MNTGSYTYNNLINKIHNFESRLCVFNDNSTIADLIRKRLNIYYGLVQLKYGENIYNKRFVCNVTFGFVLEQISYIRKYNNWYTEDDLFLQYLEILYDYGYYKFGINLRHYKIINPYTCKIEYSNF